MSIATANLNRAWNEIRGRWKEARKIMATVDRSGWPLWITKHRETDVEEVIYVCERYRKSPSR